MQKEACNQREKSFKQIRYSRMHSASSATGENVLQWEQFPFLKKMGKCALGFKGSNPLEDNKITFNLFRFLTRSAFVRSFPPPPLPRSSLSSKK